MTPEEQTKLFDEILKIAEADRDKLVSFYDVRLVLGCYLGIAAQLGAAMLKHNILTPDRLSLEFLSALEGALTHQSNTKCVFKHGDDAIEGGKQ